MSVEIRHAPFDPWHELSLHEERMAARRGSFGATAVFVGTMRDFNEGEAVHGMSLEHYPGMTENYLDRICREAQERWALEETLILHRVGDLGPADPIVLVAAWSAHRKEAFEACRELMEMLKSRAPFWKKERLDSGSRWVEKNTAGY